MSEAPPEPLRARGPLEHLLLFCLRNRLVVWLLVLFVVGWGMLVAPFQWDVLGLPRDPVPVDAIPDLGENQQIVFTRWPGRSPQDVQDQITYPLTVSLLGLPQVKTIRSHSFFGFSSIYVIFDEDAEFYWSRSRVLEKLASLPADTLPEGVQPALGPDATALGQVFWYTLEGRDREGRPAGGWDLGELRSIQDWTVRYALTSAEGISEVASIGGFVKEYQIDVDPDAMRAYGVTLPDVIAAVRMSNLDVGARTIEVNRVEYVIRGLGFLESIEDVDLTVVATRENVPVYVKDVARVELGPAMRRGALDKAGAEAVGGVAVVRYGYNPLEAIANLRERIAEIAPGLPRKVVVDWRAVERSEVAALARLEGFAAFRGEELDQEAWLAWIDARPERTPDWLAVSQVTIQPFYDRTGLIHETLGTLSRALVDEILVAVVVVIALLLNLRSSILVSALLPLSVLMCFIAMRAFGVDANIVALSGIAIAIGTMVDVGIILTENVLRHLDEAPEGEDPLASVFRGASEVGGAVLAAVATTVVGFLPVFTMTATEGKLFRPLAFTKTFALIASVVTALVIIPPAAHALFAGRVRRAGLRRTLHAGIVLAGAVLAFSGFAWAGGLVALLGAYALARPRLSTRTQRMLALGANAAAGLFVLALLAEHWRPLGVGRGDLANLVFAAVWIGGLLLLFWLFRAVYPRILRACLAHKAVFLSIVCALLVAGACSWLGFARVAAPVGALADRLGAGDALRGSRGWELADAAFPGLGKEFMPPLDEGSFLYMPTTMPHASIGEALEVLQLQDERIAAIPEVETVVGKIGRVESALDPAPVSMVETVVTYRSEFRTDAEGLRLRFRFDEERGEFARDASGELIEDEGGRPFRQWRDSIRTPDDIWHEIVNAAQVPGSTSAPRLQPIAARLVMLQTGLRAPMGLRIRGPDLESIEAFGLRVEELLKRVPGVEPSSVFAERIVGKPYLEIDLDRERLARYGLHVKAVQDVIEVAVGGRAITTTVEGRERYPVRVRYLRELRDDIESLDRILVPAPGGAQIPLAQLADVRYVRGPQAIKSEDTFLVGYVILDKQPGLAEVDVVEDCQRFLADMEASGELVRPPGVSYAFTGSYQNQVRAQKTLAIVLPVALFLIFLILYLQFRSVPTALFVFSGVAVAWSGGFLLLWLYGQPWFLDVQLLGANLREVFQVHPVNLSVAIWVGFLALFGIATDDGVVVATYLDQSFGRRRPETVAEIRAATLEAGRRRVRPCLMTTATTILALLPVLTSTGRGADIMVPMAIPTMGGMSVALLTMFIVPVLYCALEEARLAWNTKSSTSAATTPTQA